MNSNGFSFISVVTEGLPLNGIKGNQLKVLPIPNVGELIGQPFTFRVSRDTTKASPLLPLMVESITRAKKRTKYKTQIFDSSLFVSCYL